MSHSSFTMAPYLIIRAEGSEIRGRKSSTNFAASSRLRPVMAPIRQAFCQDLAALTHVLFDSGNRNQSGKVFSKSDSVPSPAGCG